MNRDELIEQLLKLEEDTEILLHNGAFYEDRFKVKPIKENQYKDGRPCVYLATTVGH